MRKKNYNNKKRDNKANANKQEKLTASIGDLLEAKGEIIPWSIPVIEANSNNRVCKQDAIKETIQDKSETPVEIVREEENKVTIEDLKKNGIDLSKVPVYIDMGEKEIVEENAEAIVSEGNWDEFAKLFTESKKEVKENTPADKIHIGAEYITKEGTDKQIKTDTFITK